MIIIPKTKSGKWALYIFILMVILFVIANLFMNNPRVEPPEYGTVGINWPIIPGFVAGLIASVFAIFAIVREKERSIVVFLIPVILLLLLFFGSRQT